MNTTTAAPVTCSHDNLDMLSLTDGREVWECSDCSHTITRAHEHVWEKYRATLPTCTASRGAHVFGQCECPTAEACWYCDATR